MSDKDLKALEAVKLGDLVTESDTPILIPEKRADDLKELEHYSKELLSCSEDENVERFIRLCEDKFVTISGEKRNWYVYDENTGKYINDNSEPKNFYFDKVCKEIESDCFKYQLEHKGDNNFKKDIENREKWLIKSKTDRIASAVLKRAFDKLNKGNSVASYFDKSDNQNIRLFNCLNRTLQIDLKSKTIKALPHDPKHKLSFSANVKFDEKADCPIWKKCISTYMLNDEKTALYLQALLGLSIAGINTDQIFVIMSGGGSNGKSTVLKHIQCLMGDYGIKCRNDIFTKGNSKVDDNVIWAMRGKRFGFCSEGDKKAVLDIGRLKDITGGEEIATRPLYHFLEFFKPEFIPIFATNVLPMIYDNGNSIERRARVISFNHTIKGSERDPFIDSKLEKEYSGILNWLIAGLKLWFKNGCSLEPLTSERIRNDSKQYLFSNDYILQFTQEKLIPDPEHRESDKDTYNAYVDWCSENNLKPVRKKDFVNRIKQIYCRYNFEKQNDGINKEIEFPLKDGYKTIKGFSIRKYRLSDNYVG